MLDQATGQIMIYILPVLLAIKYRNEHNFITMGGTIIGVLYLLSSLVQELTYSIFAHLGLHGDKKLDMGEEP